MFGDGTQPLEEAEDHNPVWVAKEIEPVKQSGAGTQVSV